MLEHRFAKLTAVATFLLLLVGGTVNVTGSSLACPEPTFLCNGELFPEMTGGVLYEHGHRLVAMTVGLLQVIFAVLLWRRRPSLKWLGVGALVLVSVQGALGAITVKYKLPTAVSVTHLIVAFLYFALLIYLAWRTRPETAAAQRPNMRAARPWILLALGAVFAQIVLGAILRHTGGALACIDLPLCNGSIMPAGAPLPLAVHMIHRVSGVVVGIVTLVAALQVYRHGRGWPRLRSLALVAPVLVAAQIALGVLTIYTLRSTPVAVAHFGGAAALWSLWLLIALMTGSRRAPAPLRSAPPRNDIAPMLAGATS